MALAQDTLQRGDAVCALHYTPEMLAAGDEDTQLPARAVKSFDNLVDGQMYCLEAANT